MLILVDTNVLLRLAEPLHAQHATAVESIGSLNGLNHDLVIVPQVAYEFWAVSTRPVEVNGLGLSSIDTKSKLDGFLAVCRVLRDERTVFDYWYRLVLDHNVMGKQAHDARLIAAMQRHGIAHLLTFNTGDFARYPGITIIDPHQANALAPAE